MPTTRLRGPVAGTLAAATAGTAAVAVAAGAGGLQVNPLRLDAPARPGLVGRVNVSNPSTDAITATITPRRWKQSVSGLLAPDLRRQGVLGGVQVSTRTVTLAPQASRVVEVRLAHVPRGGYLYAALVVRGAAAQKGAGPRPTYQISSALHIEPPAALRRYRLKASSPRVARRGRGLRVTAAVQNLGNLTDPVSGTITVRRDALVRTARIAARPILPKHKVDLSATLPRGLPAGHYRLTVRVTQGSGRRGTHAQTFRRLTILRGGAIKR